MTLWCWQRMAIEQIVAKSKELLQLASSLNLLSKLINLCFGWVGTGCYQPHHPFHSAETTLQRAQVLCQKRTRDTYTRGIPEIYLRCTWDAPEVQPLIRGMSMRCCRPPAAFDWLPGLLEIGIRELWIHPVPLGSPLPHYPIGIQRVSSQHLGFPALSPSPAYPITRHPLSCPPDFISHPFFTPALTHTNLSWPIFHIPFLISLSLILESCILTCMNTARWAKTYYLYGLDELLSECTTNALILMKC